MIEFDDAYKTDYNRSEKELCMVKLSMFAATGISLLFALSSCDMLNHENRESVNQPEQARSISSFSLTIENTSSSYVRDVVQMTLNRPTGAYAYTLMMNGYPIVNYNHVAFPLNSKSVSFNWNTTGFQDGQEAYFEYNVYYQNQNNARFSGSVTLTVMNHPGQGITAIPNNTNITGNTIPVFTNYQGQDIGRVEFFYDNNYAGSDSTQPYSYNIAVPVEDRGTHTVTAKVFESAGNSLIRTYSTSVFINNPISRPCTIGDFDGDGRTDAVSFEYYLNQSNLFYGKGYFFKAQSNGFDSGQEFLVSLPYGTTSVTLAGVADLNNDGKKEIVLEYKSALVTNWVVASFVNSNTFAQGIWTTTSSANAKAVGIKDTDGDGKPDLVIQFDSGDTRYWEARLSNGSSFVDPDPPWTSTQTTNVWSAGLADADGDGKADLLLCYIIGDTEYWQIRKSSGSSFIYKDNWSSTTTTNVSTHNNNMIVTDLTGDGKSDLIISYLHNNNIYWQVRPSTGTAYSAGPDWSSTGTLNAITRQFADFDGNGQPDMLIQYVHNDTIYWQIRPNMGNGRFEAGNNWTSTGTLGAEYLGVGDLDGDGKLDLYISFWDANANTRYLQVRKSTGSSFTYDPACAISISNL